MSNVPEDTPLTDFTDCHKGIVVKLQQLRSLAEAVRDENSKDVTQKLAKELLGFFSGVILEHHKEEEEELFRAVALSAVKGDEATRANGLIKQLTDEHREIEALWGLIEPAIKKLAKGKNALLFIQTSFFLSEKYLAHAEFEEKVFLPMSAQILDKNGMSALGMSLHMRHVDIQSPYYI